MISPMRQRAVLISILSILLGGCASTPRGYVAKEWSLTMRELGIVPVFPPREDVQVGDVYVAPVSPDQEVEAFKKKRYLPLGLWLATLDLSNEVSNFYSSRPSFPLTPTNTPHFMQELTNNPFGGLPQAADSSRNIFVGGDTTRLRMAAFPSFMSATFNKGDLAGVVPVESVNLAFGAGFSSARSVTVSVPVAESYGVPVDKVWRKIMNANGGLMDFVPNVPRNQLHNLVNASQVVRDGTNYYAPVRVITEVYYTRALDIAVVTKTTRGFGMAGRPLATDALSAARSALTSSNSNSPASNSASASANAPASTNAPASATGSNSVVYISPGVTNLSGTAVERAAEMNRSLDQAMTQTAPGGSVKFIAAGDRGVTLRRTYDRPIAIGYRAAQVLVPIEAPNGLVSGAVAGFVPTSSSGGLLSPAKSPAARNSPSTTPPPPTDNEPTTQPGQPIKP